MRVSLDIETESLDKVKWPDGGLVPHQSRITCIGWYEIQSGVRQVFRGKDLLLQFLNKWAKNPSADFEGHGFKFDIKMLVYHIKREHGGDYSSILLDAWEDDTQLLAYVMPDKIPQRWLSEYAAERRLRNKELPKGVSHRPGSLHSLKTLAPYHLGVAPFWEDPADHNNDEYVLKDVEYTARLLEVLKKKCNTEDYKFYKECQLPWTKELLRAELKGIRIDQELLPKKQLHAQEAMKAAEGAIRDQWAKHFEQYATTQCEQLNERYTAMAEAAFIKSRNKSVETFTKIRKRYAALGLKAEAKLDTKLNLNSPTQLQWLLRDQLGYDIANFDGEDSTEGEVLERLATMHPDIKPLLDYRKYSKLCSTYYPSYYEYMRDGRIHCEFTTDVTRTGRTSVKNPSLQNQPEEVRDIFIADRGYKLITRDLCLHPKTELLTKAGWKPVLTIGAEDEVWQVDKTTLTGSWTKSIRTINQPWSGPLVTYGNTRGRLTVTPGHRMLFVGQIHKKRPDKAELRWEVDASDSLPNTGMSLATHTSGATLDSSLDQKIVKEIWQSTAIAADGHRVKNGVYDIQVSKIRKRAKMQELFGPGRVAKKIRPVHTLICETWSWVKYQSSLLCPESRGLTLDNLPGRYADHLVKALQFWDGHKEHGASIGWSTLNEQQCDHIQGWLVRHGYEAKKSKNTNGCFKLRIKKNSRIRLRNQDITTEGYIGPVGCVTVPSGYILVRSEGQTFITGNCAIEPRLIAYFSEDPALCDIMINELDFHAVTAQVIFPTLLNHPLERIKKDFPRERYVAKTAGLAIMYGSGAKRMKKILDEAGFTGYTIAQCKQMVERIRRKYKGVWDFKLKLDQELERGKVVYNLFGRPIKFADRSEVYMKGFNRLIQGSASDLLLNAIQLISEEAREARIDAGVLLAVHDEIVLQAPEYCAIFYEKKLDEFMTSRELLTPYGEIKLQTEGGISDRWEK